MPETVRIACTCTLATVHEWLNACLHMAVHGAVTGSCTTNDIGTQGLSFYFPRFALSSSVAYVEGAGA
jgi:hypothetical protein